MQWLSPPPPPPLGLVGNTDANVAGVRGKPDAAAVRADALLSAGQHLAVLHPYLQNAGREEYAHVFCILAWGGNIIPYLYTCKELS